MNNDNRIHGSQTFVQIFAPILVAATLLLALPVAQAGEKQAVIMQISQNDPQAWSMALSVANNLQTNLGKDNVDVEIVAFGPGIEMFTLDTSDGNRLTKAANAGVRLRACGQTMKVWELSDKDLHPGVQIVAGGVIEIMEKVKGGWTYIRP